MVSGQVSPRVAPHDTPRDTPNVPPVSAPAGAAATDESDNRAPVRGVAWWRHKVDLEGEIRRAVERATSIDEEALALVAPLEPRHQTVILVRWGRGVGRIPTLVEAGKATGLHRERVRQVVFWHEGILNQMAAIAELVLPRARAAAEMILTERDGLLAADLVRELARQGIATTPEGLGTLRGLSRMQLVPRVVYDPATTNWHRPPRDQGVKG